MKSTTEPIAFGGGYAAHNQIQLVRADAEGATAQLDADETSLNPAGRVHGGALFGLVDSVAGAATRWQGGQYVTLDAEIHYLKAALPGLITATAKVVHRGRTTCYVRVEVRSDQSDLLCDASVTMFCLQPPAQPE